jgi:hypothetical protein
VLLDHKAVQSNCNVNILIKFNCKLKKLNKLRKVLIILIILMCKIDVRLIKIIVDLSYLVFILTFNPCNFLQFLFSLDNIICILIKKYS